MNNKTDLYFLRVVFYVFIVSIITIFVFAIWQPGVILKQVSASEYWERFGSTLFGGIIFISLFNFLLNCIYYLIRYRSSQKNKDFDFHLSHLDQSTETSRLEQLYLYWHVAITNIYAISFAYAGVIAGAILGLFLIILLVLAFGLAIFYDLDCLKILPTDEELRLLILAIPVFCILIIYWICQKFKICGVFGILAVYLIYSIIHHSVVLGKEHEVENYLKTIGYVKFFIAIGFWGIDIVMRENEEIQNKLKSYETKGVEKSEPDSR